jgi:pimeloyl-ACP methyl ester carboxylesterase
MPRVTSKDGTAIAFDKSGHGPALILVGGAYQDRSALAGHASLLASHFTVYNYDRRGRGESGDTSPYAVEREIEDIDALLRNAGESTFLFGGSSGAVLALGAAARIPGIPKLALWEPPFVVDATRPPVAVDFLSRLKAMIASGRRGDAAAAYMTEGADLPRATVEVMRTAPFWVGAEAAAHTLVYDATIMDGTMLGRPLPANRWAAVTMPTLVMHGDASPVWMRKAALALVDTLPNASLQEIEGQAHDVGAEALASALEPFFAPDAVGRVPIIRSPGDG